MAPSCCALCLLGELAAGPERPNPIGPSIGTAQPANQQLWTQWPCPAAAPWWPPAPSSRHSCPPASGARWQVCKRLLSADGSAEASYPQTSAAWAAGAPPSPCCGRNAAIPRRAWPARRPWHPAAAAAAFPAAAAGRQARTLRAAPRPAGRNLGPVAEANLFSRVARIFKSYANAAGAAGGDLCSPAWVTLSLSVFTVGGYQSSAAPTTLWLYLPSCISLLTLHSRVAVLQSQPAPPLAVLAVWSCGAEWLCCRVRCLFKNAVQYFAGCS